MNVYEHEHLQRASNFTNQQQFSLNEHWSSHRLNISLGWKAQSSRQQFEAIIRSVKINAHDDLCYNFAAEDRYAAPKAIRWVCRLCWIHYVACFNQPYSLLIGWEQDKMAFVWKHPVIASDVEKKKEQLCMSTTNVGLWAADLMTSSLFQVCNATESKYIFFTLSQMKAFAYISDQDWKTEKMSVFVLASVNNRYGKVFFLLLQGAGWKADVSGCNL